MITLQIENGAELREVSLPIGTLLSDVLRAQGLLRDLPCGGKGTCGQCRVRVSGELSPATAEEQRRLSTRELADGVRLACQARANGDTRVALLQRGEFRRIVIGTELPAFTKNPAKGRYGAAVDVGTTSVTASLYRLSDCTPAQTAAIKNPQAVYGADVISRIEQSLAGKGDALKIAIAGGIDRLLLQAAMQTGIDTTEIDAAVITGNTTMLCLLAGRDVACLSHAPFEADELFGGFAEASALWLTQTAANARIYLPRCISAFVGADITTAILASGLLEGETPALLIDIGTNGEIAAYDGARLLCCSTAAGPAFEGAGIHMGMNAMDGAIDSVSLRDGVISYTTIGDAPACGICGSGIIDAAAVLLEAGILDETGLLQGTGHPFETWMIPFEGNFAFRFDGCEVLLTQKDLRAIQLAKSAICAGLLTLITESGLQPEDIKRLYIAGGFGNYISVANAARIGLIPQELAEHAVIIGNAAAKGAALLLLSTDLQARAEHIANGAVTVDLSTSRIFMDNYMDCMLFE